MKLDHLFTNLKLVSERIKKKKHILVPPPPLLTLARLGGGAPQSEGQGPLPLPLQDSVGICSVWATMVEAILSPRAHMASLGGPEESGTGGRRNRVSHKAPHSRVPTKCQSSGPRSQGVYHQVREEKRLGLPLRQSTFNTCGL